MKYLVILLPFLISSCALFKPQQFDQTYAEQQAGYSYIPVEPSEVKIFCAANGGDINTNNCNQVSKSSLLSALPDNSVRIATRQISGKISVGIPSVGFSIGSEGNSYEVIIDFVNTQTVNQQFVGK